MNRTKGPSADGASYYEGQVIGIQSFPNPNYPQSIAVMLDPGQDKSGGVVAINNLYFKLENGMRVRIAHNWGTFFVVDAPGEQDSTIARAIPRS